MDKDLRLELKFKNAVLYNVIVEMTPLIPAGHGRVAEFCYLYGFHDTEVGQYLNLKKSPYTSGKNGDKVIERRLRASAQKLLDLTGLSPEILFPERLYRQAWPTLVVDTTSDRFLALSAAPKSALLLPASQEGDLGLADTLSSVVRTLTPQEATVINMRFGLGGDEPLTLQAAGRRLSVGKERVRQIEAKALRKLRHHSRATKLKPFVEGAFEPTRAIVPAKC